MKCKDKREWRYVIRNLDTGLYLDTYGFEWIPRTGATRTCICSGKPKIHRTRRCAEMNIGALRHEGFENLVVDIL